MKKILLAGLFTCTICACQSDNFTPSDDMVQISPAKALKLDIGQEAYFQGREHASIGKQLQVQIQDTTIIKLIAQYEDHDAADWAESAGGDMATKTFVFKALKIGQSKILIREMYRNEIKKETPINCNIVAQKND